MASVCCCLASLLYCVCGVVVSVALVIVRCVIRVKVVCDIVRRRGEVGCDVSDVRMASSVFDCEGEGEV